MPSSTLGSTFGHDLERTSSNLSRIRTQIFGIRTVTNDSPSRPGTLHSLHDQTPVVNAIVSQNDPKISGNKLPAPISADTSAPTPEEPEPTRLERLGRQRPPQFKTQGAEIAFAYSILASQMMAEYFVSGFNVILPTLITTLHIPSASAVWPASATALTTAAFLLPMGRLADMYGGYPVYLGGLAWFTVWSVVAGFAAGGGGGKSGEGSGELFLDFCRAMQGLGPAAFLPSGVMLLGSIYRPGPRKNLMFSLYGSAAPLGFFLGIFVAGVTGSYLPTGWCESSLFLFLYAC